jgi:hypothetical protein
MEGNGLTASQVIHDALPLAQSSAHLLSRLVTNSWSQIPLSIDGLLSVFLAAGLRAEQFEALANVLEVDSFLLQSLLELAGQGFFT